MDDTQIAQQIISGSAVVDAAFVHASATSFRAYRLTLPTPRHHTRFTTLPEGVFTIEPMPALAISPDTFYLVDDSLRPTFIAKLLPEMTCWVTAQEHTLKEIGWLDAFITERVPAGVKRIVGIGGGILLNAAPYIAEKLGCDFVSVPTTVLAAADSAIGGLIRLNRQDDDRIERSAYKSVYEPSSILLDPRFLETLPEAQIRFGLSEVVKHGAYQSLPLLQYLASEQYTYQSTDDILKAICWTAALKNVVIMHDPDSLSFGGTILRGGHTLARELEEQSHFRMSHGEAVAVGVYQDKSHDPVLQPLLDTIYKKLALPKTAPDRH